jgi:hypothetical protein
LPYINGKWTPDPEDAKYTDPDPEKYLDEKGNDTRYGYSFKDCFVPDPPEIVELKKSGEWAQMRPIHRRWYLADTIRPYITDESHEMLKKITDNLNK